MYNTRIYSILYYVHMFSSYDIEPFSADGRLGEISLTSGGRYDNLVNQFNPELKVLSIILSTMYIVLMLHGILDNA